jgi:hypothetical protein
VEEGLVQSSFAVLTLNELLKVRLTSLATVDDNALKMTTARIGDAHLLHYVNSSRTQATRHDTVLYDRTQIMAVGYHTDVLVKVL